MKSKIVKTPEEFEARARRYMDECREDGKRPTIAGLTMALGFKSKQSFFTYSKDPEFSETLDFCRLMLCDNIEQEGRGGNAQPFNIFLLKNFGYTDSQDINHRSPDGSMSPDGLTSEQRRNRIQELLNKKTDSPENGD